MAAWTNISRLLAASIVVAISVLLFSTPANAQRQAEDRAKVIAAFLYKFLSFVEWPEAAFSSPADAFRIVVLHDDDVKAAVAESVAGKEVKGRTIAVVEGDEMGDAMATCHVVFLGDVNETRVRNALDRIAGRPVLTVGLDERFAKQGGVIRLFEEDRRLSIEVNLIAARHARLEISSKLLAVAKVLREPDEKTQADRDDTAELPERSAGEKVD